MYMNRTGLNEGCKFYHLFLYSRLIVPILFMCFFTTGQPLGINKCFFC